MQLQLPPYLKVIAILFGLFLFFWGLEVASGVLIPLAFAFVLSLLLYPIVYKLEKHRVPRSLAILIAMILILAVIGLIITLIYSEIVGFYDEFPLITSRIEMHLADLQKAIEERFRISPDNQITWLNTNIERMMENSGDLFSNIIFVTSGVIAKVVIVPFYIFFILYYRDLFRDFIFRITPQEKHENAALILKKIQLVIQNYLVGLFTVIAIMALVNTAGLLIIGVDHAIFFGVLAAILIIIPYVGVLFGSALPILYSFAMSDSLWIPFSVLIFFTIVQTIEGNLLSPNITGSKVSINPLVAILALFIGAEVWGIAGMILFVPFVAMAKVVFDHIEEMKPYGIVLGTEKKLRFKDLWDAITLKSFKNHH